MPGAPAATSRALASASERMPDFLRATPTEAKLVKRPSQRKPRGSNLASRVEQALMHDVDVADGDDGAVARRRGAEPVERGEAARALHRLHHHRRMARDEAAKMPRHQLPVDAVGAADAGADDHPDGLAFVEIGDVVGMGAGRARPRPGRRHASGKSPTKPVRRIIVSSSALLLAALIAPPLRQQGSGSAPSPNGRRGARCALLKTTVVPRNGLPNSARRLNVPRPSR